MASQLQPSLRIHATMVDWYLLIHDDEHSYMEITAWT